MKKKKLGKIRFTNNRNKFKTLPITMRQGEILAAQNNVM